MHKNLKKEPVRENLTQVLEGIFTAAKPAGFLSGLKINAVILKHRNHTEALPFSAVRH
jgi:molybdenum cofactor biosynthesis enzyme MoaA